MVAYCLREYQQDMLAKLRTAFKEHRSVMLQMPTGTGKTVVLAAVVNEELRTKNEELTVWIVAHRRELVAQVEETLARFGIDTDGGGRVRVMSVQWLALHVGEMAVRPRLVIIDEAHHAQAATYRMLWDECPQARFLGLTATPCRMSGSGFTDLFDVLVTSWSIAEFVKRGYLSAFDYASIRPGSREQLLVDSLEKRGADGDYQVKELNAVFNRRQSIGRLYESVRRFADKKKGIVYAISIDHARRIAEYYNHKGICTVAIDSRTPAVERKRLVDDFKAGRIRVMVNVDVFSEGFDCPDVEFVQLARPTLSLAKYLQQAGRGLRVAAGKSGCVFIDNVGLYRVFGLPTVAWDWQSMFRGDTSGRGVRRCAAASSLRQQGDVSAGLSCASVAPVLAGHESADASVADDMEMIVSHGELLTAISCCDSVAPPSAAAPRAAVLKAWHDASVGLYGLRLGRRDVTGAVYKTVFDVRYDMAAVRFADNRCGLVGKDGDVVWRTEIYRSMKFSRNYFLSIITQDNKECYLDLHSMRMYNEHPEVKCFGRVEMLKVGRTYYSRTKVVYENRQNLTPQLITDNIFGITVFDYKMPVLSGWQSVETYRCGYACILNDDYDSFYWVYRLLADKSIIIADGKGRFYHVGSNQRKEYLGSVATASDRTACMSAIESIECGMRAAHSDGMAISGRKVMMKLT